MTSRQSCTVASHTHSEATALPNQGRGWQLPLYRKRYDTTPQLSAKELSALDDYLHVRVSHMSPTSHQARNARKDLKRFEQPLRDLGSGRHWHDEHLKAVMAGVRLVLYKEMARRKTAFWAWSSDEWRETVCYTRAEFNQRFFRPDHLRSDHTSGDRLLLLLFAYLVCDGAVLHVRQYEAEKIATAVFGAAPIQAAVGRVNAALISRGYSPKRDGRKILTTVLCRLFLHNRSPYLEDLSIQVIWDMADALERFPRKSTFGDYRACAIKVGRTLHELDILPSWTEPQRREESYPNEAKQNPEDANSWNSWVDAWYAHDTALSLPARRSARDYLRCSGRWLATTHPEITSPEQWDEAVALEYVEHVSSGTAGTWAGAERRSELKKLGKLGNPLAPRTIDRYLQHVRVFFLTLQQRPLQVGTQPPKRIGIRFNPQIALRTPPHIKRKIQPDPRDIDVNIWYKLTYAAATLSEEDLKRNLPHLFYPLELYQAVALLWVSAGRRVNELTRLRVGCIRREWDPGMLDERGVPVADETGEQRERLCYLHVPLNKTRGPFWVWVPPYVADVVESWEKKRPKHQPKLLDSKDNSLADFLFCFRGRQIGIRFINKTIIPLLCEVAGVPERDARGQITSHRGRSSRASLLRSLGVSLDDISEYLGHKNRNAVLQYARTQPVQLARTIREADKNARIAHGILDPGAAVGKPNTFFLLHQGPDGQRTYCANPSWVSCKKRMDCGHCTMFVGAEAAERLETRNGVVYFQAFVPLTPAERAACQGDLDALNDELKTMRAEPLPEPPSPDYITNPTALQSQTQPAEAEAGFAYAQDLINLAQLELHRQALQQEIAAAQSAPGNKRAVMKALKRRLEETEQLIRQQERISIDSSTE